MFYNIVQIGAFVGNDDVHNILVNETDATALLVEPVEYYLNKLKENYKNIPNPKRIKFSNEVLNTYDGECDFHCVLDDEYSYNYNSEKNWVPEISGVNLQLIKEHEQYLNNQSIKYNTVKLKCLSPLSFIDKHDIIGIEFLKLDAEGLDFELLMKWPFNIIKPKYLKFEVCHLDGHINEKTKFNSLNKFLNNKNYKFLEANGLDVVYSL